MYVDCRCFSLPLSTRSIFMYYLETALPLAKQAVAAALQEGNLKSNLAPHKCIILWTKALGTYGFGEMFDICMSKSIFHFHGRRPGLSDKLGFQRNYQQPKNLLYLRRKVRSTLGFLSDPSSQCCGRNSIYFFADGYFRNHFQRGKWEKGDIARPTFSYVALFPLNHESLARDSATFFRNLISWCFKVLPLHDFS